MTTVDKLLETLKEEAEEVDCFHCGGWGHHPDGNICSHCNGKGVMQGVSVKTVTALLTKFLQEQELSGYLGSPREGVALTEKVLVSRKQLEEEKKEALEHVGFWRMAKQNDNSPPFSNEQVIARAKVCWIEELLAGSGQLSPEEIKDVEASEKEFAEGKCKTFETAEDLIADLQKGRKKGSGDKTDSVELLRQSRDRYQKAVESQEEGSGSDKYGKKRETK